MFSACARRILTLTGGKEPPLTFDFIRVKSYSNTESTGDVRIESVGLDLTHLKGRNVLLCEDIIDTGTTMSKLVPYLESFGPTSVRVATLLEKRTPKSIGFKGDFVGFSIPDKFVVGCTQTPTTIHPAPAPCPANARRPPTLADVDGPDP